MYSAYTLYSTKMIIDDKILIILTSSHDKLKTRFDLTEMPGLSIKQNTRCICRTNSTLRACAYCSNKIYILHKMYYYIFDIIIKQQSLY